MPIVTTDDGVDIFYKDWGSGQPIMFHHGWPLSSDDWDSQVMFFLQHGYRVFAHDRRGHGRSAQVSDGHDMDHYAADAAATYRRGRSAQCREPDAGTGPAHRGRSTGRDWPTAGAYFGCLYSAAMRPEEAADLRRDNLDLPDEGWGWIYLEAARPHAGGE